VIYLNCAIMHGLTNLKLPQLFRLLTDMSTIWMTDS